LAQAHRYMAEPCFPGGLRPYTIVSQRGTVTGRVAGPPGSKGLNRWWERPRSRARMVRGLFSDAKAGAARPFRREGAVSMAPLDDQLCTGGLPRRSPPRSGLGCGAQNTRLRPGQPGIGGAGHLPTPPEAPSVAGERDERFSAVRCDQRRPAAISVSLSPPSSPARTARGDERGEETGLRRGCGAAVRTRAVACSLPVPSAYAAASAGLGRQRLGVTRVPVGRWMKRMAADFTGVLRYSRRRLCYEENWMP